MGVCAGGHSVILGKVSVVSVSGGPQELGTGRGLLSCGGADGRGVEPLQVVGSVSSAGREVGDTQGFGSDWRVTDGDGDRGCSGGHWTQLRQYKKKWV